MVAAAEHSDGLWNVVLSVFMAKFYLAFFHDVEMVAAVALVENKISLKLGCRCQTVDQLDLLVLLEFIEEFDFVKEVERDVASSNAVLGNREFEAFTGQNPSFAVGEGGYGRGTLVVVKKGDFAEADHALGRVELGVCVQVFLEGDVIGELGVEGVGVGLVHRHAHGSFGEHEVLGANVTEANNIFAADKLPRKHRVCESFLFLGIHVLREERRCKKLEQALGLRGILGVHWCHVRCRLLTRLKRFVEH